MPMPRDIGARLIVDTNVLLDASFVPHGVARRALLAAAGQGLHLYIDHAVELEAAEILADRRLALGLRYDAWTFMERFLCKAACVRVEAAPLTVNAPNINRSDQHVARAAIYHDATVLTSDANLVLECRNNGIRATFPWALIFDRYPAEEILRVAPLSPTCGSLFARVTPGGWKGLSGVGRFTAVDIAGLGSLAFDTATREWIFKSDSGRELKLSYAAAGEDTTIVCLNYDAQPEALKCRLVLRAARFGSDHHETKSEEGWERPRGPLSELRIGSTRDGQTYWNGHIRHLTAGPDRVSKKLWRALRKLADGAPDPLNHDVLDGALQTLARHS